jgi:prolipoprotein diacylglyceryltransferase
LQTDHGLVLDVPKVNPHVVFEALAYFVGFQLYLRDRRLTGDPIGDSTRWSIVAAAIVGAAAGSRLLYWCVAPAETLAHWNDLRYLLGGKTVVGGLLGGIIAVELAKRALGVTARTGDLFAVPLAVGIAIGESAVSCPDCPTGRTAFRQACHGRSTFGDGIPRHPVQLV